MRLLPDASPSFYCHKSLPRWVDGFLAKGRAVGEGRVCNLLLFLYNLRHLTLYSSRRDKDLGHVGTFRLRVSKWVGSCVVWCRVFQPAQPGLTYRTLAYSVMRIISHREYHSIFIADAFSPHMAPHRPLRNWSPQHVSASHPRRMSLAQSSVP